MGECGVWCAECRVMCRRTRCTGWAHVGECKASSRFLKDFNPLHILLNPLMKKWGVVTKEQKWSNVSPVVAIERGLKKSLNPSISSHPLGFLEIFELNAVVHLLM